MVAYTTWGPSSATPAYVPHKLSQDSYGSPCGALPASAACRVTRSARHTRSSAAAAARSAASLFCPCTRGSRACAAAGRKLMQRPWQEAGSRGLCGSRTRTFTKQLLCVVQELVALGPLVWTLKQQAQAECCCGTKLGTRESAPLSPRRPVRTPLPGHPCPRSPRRPQQHRWHGHGPRPAPPRS